MAGVTTKLYNAVLRRTSTFVLGGFAAVFFFERAFDLGIDSAFERANNGKLYKHIKDRFASESE